jgi:hypothetical protein
MYSGARGEYHCARPPRNVFRVALDIFIHYSDLYSRTATAPDEGCLDCETSQAPGQTHFSRKALQST